MLAVSLLIVRTQTSLHSDHQTDSAAVYANGHGHQASTTSSLMDWNGSVSARSSRSPDPPAFGAPEATIQLMDVHAEPPNSEPAFVHHVRESLIHAGVIGMHVFAADPPATSSPATEDCTSIDPRITRVIDFIRATIAHALPASTNRIEALIDAVIYIEGTKGFPRYQVRDTITSEDVC
jgi:hypothetical protein